MATYPLSFPTKAISGEQLMLYNRQAAMESPHTLAFQSVNTAAQWHLNFTWPRMSEPQARVVQGWLDSLMGQVGTFRYTPRSGVVNALSGRKLALSAYAYGTNASMSGWASNSPSELSVGQFFSIGSQLLRITSASANADAAGNVLVEFTPMLRKDFGALTAVNFATPSGLFRLSSPETPSYTIDTDRLVTFPSVSAKEAF